MKDNPFKFAIIVISAFLLIGLVFCGPKPAQLPSAGQPSASLSASAKPVSSEDASTPIKTTAHHGDTWEIDIPPNWVETSDKDIPSIIELSLSDRDGLVLFSKEKFSGTLEDYSLISVVGLSEMEIVVDDSFYIEKGGNRYFVLYSSHGSVNMISWMAVKNGFGYILACGGQEDFEPTSEKECFKMFQSLKIK